ncbi:DNA polymerase III subunit chi [Candidatus Pantoea edessiphila]|uniref:DNA polymerase III subunit chi n=1 Tax=Candidatus Pantoea edessiphila TaxID=2044610 RepID=A0A2P5T247_9GAMM|nr:DNA polymerase III subunit chi [Candidatus Pantoea edessiphila]PPI88620.1 DNA polymerase III subunit chi [Candidatus Pantoea edessiphila]
MKIATFYTMTPQYVSDNDLNNIEVLVCYIVKKYWYKGKNILIYCENIYQAIRIDEMLWQKPLNAFIPHSLIGENITCKVPIEIAWLKTKINSSSYDVLINLVVGIINIASNFNEIVDFVPYKEHLKKLARIRYKEYRKIGFKLNITKFSN